MEDILYLYVLEGTYYIIMSSSSWYDMISN
jgi:hypothetical protein